VVEQKGVQPPVRRAGTHQREAGAASRRETRRRLLVAAGELFAERGYAGSTVTAIAERAGVSLQTLYLAWGSKRALLRAFAETALSGRPEGTEDYLPGLQAEVDARAGGSPDPRDQLRGLAGLYRWLASGGTDRPPAALAWQLYRDAAAADPEIAEDWAALQQVRRSTFAALLGRLLEHALRPGLTREDAAQTAWVLVSPETYDLVVRHAGRTLEQYERWLGDTLVAALLPDAP